MMHCLSDNVLNHILDTIGPRHKSIEHITSRLYKLCPEAVDSGKFKAGGCQAINPLTAVQTVTVQKSANLSSSQ